VELACLSVCSWLTFRLPISLPSSLFSSSPLSDTSIIVDQQPESVGVATEEQTSQAMPLSLVSFTGLVLQLHDLYDHSITPLQTAAEWESAHNHVSVSRTTSRHVSNSSSSSGFSRYYNNFKRSVSSADSGHERFDIRTVRPFSHDSPISVSVESNGRVRPIFD